MNKILCLYVFLLFIEIILIAIILQKVSDYLDDIAYFSKFIIFFEGIFLVLNLCLLCFEKQFIRKRKFQCFWIITSVFYMTLTVLILIFDIMLIEEVRYSIQQREIICQIQLTLQFIWKFILLYTYLEYNGKLKKLHYQFGKVELLYKIILILIIIICLTYNLYQDAYYLYGYSFVFDRFFFFLLKLNSLILIEILLLIYQLKVLFISIGFQQRKEKKLTIMIYIQLALYNFNLSDNNYYFNEISYQIQLMTFLILIISDLNSINQEQTQDLIIFNEGYPLICFKCRDQVTKNDQIVYFDNSYNTFHRFCYDEYLANTEQQQDIYYLMDLQQLTNYQYIHPLYIKFLVFLNITYIIISLNMIINNKNIQSNTSALTIQLTQLITFLCLTVFEIMKNQRKQFKILNKLQFYMSAILFLSYFYNYSLVIMTYQYFNEGDPYYISVYQLFQVLMQLIFYEFHLILLQGYLISLLIVSPKMNLMNYYAQIILYSFLLFNFQQIILGFIFVYQNMFAIGFYVINLNFYNFFFSLKSLVENKNNLLQEEIIKANKIKEVLSFYHFILIVTIIIYWIVYYEVYGGLNWLDINFLYIQLYNLIFQSYFIQNVVNQVCNALIQNKSTIIFDQLEFPKLYLNEFYIYKCAYCKQNLIKEQIVIYKTQCKHLIHKQCIKIPSLNYPWCCAIEDNRDIQINFIKNYKDRINCKLISKQQLQYDGYINIKNKRFGLKVTSLWVIQFYFDLLIEEYENAVPYYLGVICIIFMFLICVIVLRFNKNRSLLLSFFFFLTYISSSCLATLGFTYLLGNIYKVYIMFQYCQLGTMVTAFFYLLIVKNKPKAKTINMLTSIPLILIIISFIIIQGEMNSYQIFINMLPFILTWFCLCYQLSVTLVNGLDHVYQGKNTIVQKDNIWKGYILFKIYFFAQFFRWSKI